MRAESIPAHERSRPAGGFTGTKIQEIAERLRQEPHYVVSNGCLIKSIRSAEERKGPGLTLDFSSGLPPAKPTGAGTRCDIPILHLRTAANGEEIELSHISGYEGIFAL